jgi:hypothetical protein
LLLVGFHFLLFFFFLWGGGVGGIRDLATWGLKPLEMEECFITPIKNWSPSMISFCNLQLFFDAKFLMTAHCSCRFHYWCCFKLW